MSFFDSEPITMNGNFDDESLKRLKELAEIDPEITKKCIEIYNYMAKNKIGKMDLSFEDGMKFSAIVDASEWKDKPMIDLAKVCIN